MEEIKELEAHVEAIGKWASQDKNRVAFVVCGEITDDGVKTTNSLVGRDDKIARALYGNKEEDDGFKRALKLTSRMIENPLLARLIMDRIVDEISSKDSSESIKDAFKDLLEAITNKIKND